MKKTNLAYFRKKNLATLLAYKQHAPVYNLQLQLQPSPASDGPQTGALASHFQTHE